MSDKPANPVDVPHTEDAERVTFTTHRLRTEPQVVMAAALLSEVEVVDDQGAPRMIIARKLKPLDV